MRETYNLVGRLLGAPAETVALVENATVAVAQALSAFDFHPGDVLVTPVTGAYVYAMANNYNGVPRPPVVFCSGGRAREVVRRETFEDLYARDV